MDRRTFIGTGIGSGAAIVSTISAKAYAGDSPKKRRVGLIGCGWYGKCDLLQLINVEPVEVVSLCDVDSKMLKQAADLIESRQAS